MSTPIRERRRAASRFNPFRYLATTHGATLFATVTAFALAMWPVGAGWPIDPTTRRPLPLFEGLQTLLEAGGSGGLILWPLFGATNQLLAGFAFVVITAWLIARRKPVWMIVPAAAVMLVVPAAAMAWQAFVGNADNPSWVANENWLLAGVASATLALEAWLLVEVGLRWRRGTPELIDAMRDAVGEAADG